MATLGVGIINTGSGGYFQGKSSQFTSPFSGVAVQIAADGNSGHNRLTLNGIPDDPAERFSGASYTVLFLLPRLSKRSKSRPRSSMPRSAMVTALSPTQSSAPARTDLHGAAYYVFQNTYLDANTYGERAKAELCYPGHPAAPYIPRRNNDQLSQTGFVLDGPVYIPKVYDGRDKTYFMAAYERYPTHTAVNYSSRVPTAGRA